MQTIIDFLQGFVPAAFNAAIFLKSAGVLLLSILLLAVLARIIFKKQSTLNRSISSAISILYIYAITVVVISFGVNLKFLLSPLPFIRIDGDYMRLLIYPTSDYQSICGQLLSMVILAFLANLADGWLPQGKNIFTWFFFRCLSVVIAMLLHLIVNAVLRAFLPEGLLIWAPVVMLGLLVLLLCVGALKLLVGALLTTVHPLIGILYTFFFANAVGKQVTKAMLTTALLGLLVYLLYVVGCTAIYIASTALAAYIPFLLLLLILWYLVSKLL